MSPRRRRYKLLLDEMLPRREKFPVLNNFHDLKHIVHDFKKFGLKDMQIMALAQKEKRIIVTKNIKHFQNLCGEEKIDLIGVTETAAPEVLDRLIVAYLRRKKTKRMTGVFKNITITSHKH